MNGHLYDTVIYRGETLWYEDDKAEVGNSVIIANDFELIEEQQDIDVQAIEQIHKSYLIFNGKNYDFQEMINMIQDVYSKQIEIINKVNVLAAKQLDRKIREEK